MRDNDRNIIWNYHFHPLATARVPPRVSLNQWIFLFSSAMMVVFASVSTSAFTTAFGSTSTRFMLPSYHRLHRHCLHRQSAHLNSSFVSTPHHLFVIYSHVYLFVIIPHLILSESFIHDHSATLCEGDLGKSLYLKKRWVHGNANCVSVSLLVGWLVGWIVRPSAWFGCFK